MEGHDWEALGREAVELGMPWSSGLFDGGRGQMVESTFPDGDVLELHYGHDEHGTMLWCEAGPDNWPDFRDRLTALATIAWVEDVAREAYGANVGVSVCMIPGRAEAAVVSGVDVLECRRAPTLPHAAIAAVRAMKGAE